MILSEKITALRKKKGWSQEELAHQLNVSRQAVSKWESASAIPDLDRILKMSQIFGVSTDYLLKEELSELEEDAASARSEESEDEMERSVSLEEATALKELRRKSAKWSALAIAAYVLSPVPLLLLGGRAELGISAMTEDKAGGIGVMVLLLIVAASTAVLLLSNSKGSAYEFLEKEPFHLQYGVEGIVRQWREDFRGAYNRVVAVGVVLCIVGAIPLVMAAAFWETDLSGLIGVVILLLFVSVAVYLFVWAGKRWDTCQILLQEGDYARDEKTAAVKLMNKIYWSIFTAIYLGVSLWTREWHKTWIIWVCAGLLYVAVKGIVLLKQRQ